jgi:hypothetical protein
MWLSSDPSQPTRRIPPVTRPVRHGDVARLDPEELLWRDEVLGRLRSLTAALTVALTVAFVALGVALWALFANDDGGRDASAGRIRALEQRVEQLESRRVPTRDAVRAIQEQQQVLAQRLVALSDSVEQPADDVDSLRTAVDATQQAVEQLDQRIAALEQASPAP